MFAYYGAKHRLAPYYPPPKYPLIVEPFAGAMGYSMHYIGIPSIGVEKDPRVVALWNDLVGTDLLTRANEQMKGEFTTLPLLKVMSTHAPSAWTDSVWRITPQMRRNWPRVRARILRCLRTGRFQVRLGDYTDAPDMEATWFIDPPYRSAGYRQQGQRYGSEALDYEALADWCRSRRGQVIVCEQNLADWLDFRPFRAMRSRSTKTPKTNLEVIWTN